MTRTKKITLAVLVADLVAGAVGWAVSLKPLMIAGLAITALAGWLAAFIFARQVWLRAALMAALLVVLGAGLYGFNVFRAQAISNAFNSMKPPPTACAVAQADRKSTRLTSSHIPL